MELGICLRDGGEGMGWKGGRWHSIAHFNKTRKHAKKYLKNVPSHSMHCEHRLHMYIYVQRLGFARRCSVEVSHSQTNVDATSQNSYGKNNKGTREY